MTSTVNVSASSAGRDRPSAAEIGFWVFLAIAVGRINQLIPGLSALPLAKIAVLFPCAALLTQRQTLPPLSADGRGLLRAGIGMAAIAVILTPFSVWPGASRNFVIFGLPPIIAAAATACAMRKSWKFLRVTLLVLLLCGFALSIPATLHHSGRAGDAGTSYDPNDLAYVLVTVVPLGVAFLNISKLRKFKILYGFVSAVTAAALLLTGSRGGLLGFLTILTLMIFVPLGGGAPTRQIRSLRASFVAAAIIIGCGIVVWNQLPESTQERYMTLLHLNSDYNTDLDDKSGRDAIWLRGFTAFGARPYGYGPESYEMVDLIFGGQFKAPHNSYLEALVELSPLGLFFLLRMYFLTLRGLQRTRSSMLAHKNPTTDDIERAVLARALQYGVIGNMVAAFFLSDAYSMLPWVISGLTAAISALPPDGQSPQPSLSRKPPARRAARNALRSTHSAGSSAPTDGPD